MSRTESDLTATLYKQSQGYVNTRNTLTLGQEATTARPSTFNDRVFMSSIPANAPVGDLITDSSWNATYLGNTFTGSTRAVSTLNPHIVRYVDVPLQSISGTGLSDKIYTAVPIPVGKSLILGTRAPVAGNNVLTNAILPKPSNSTITLYTITINWNGSPLTDDQYIFNRDAGTIKFYTSSSQSSTPTASFWRYEGPLLSDSTQSFAKLAVGEISADPTSSLTISGRSFHQNIIETKYNSLITSVADSSSTNVGYNLESQYYSNGFSAGSPLLLNTNYTLTGGPGNVGIGTKTPTQKLDVSGGARVRGNLQIGSGIDGGNEIQFAGIYKDGQNEFTHTRITERWVANPGKTELLLYKGNDSSTSSGEGPDRVRVKAGEFRVQTYNSQQISATDYFNDGTDRLVVDNSGTAIISDYSYVTDLSNNSNPLNAQLTIRGLLTPNRLQIGSYYTAGVKTASAIQSSDFYQDPVQTGPMKDHGQDLLLNPIGGNVGIGTKTPTQRLDVAGDARVRGNLLVGSGIDGGNEIKFAGIYGDGPNEFTHTRISERYYGGSDKTELFLYKGNDPYSLNEGPDRVRVKAGEFRVQTYNSTQTPATDAYADGSEGLVVGIYGTTITGVSSNDTELRINSTKTGTNQSSMRLVSTGNESYIQSGGGTLTSTPIYVSGMAGVNTMARFDTSTKRMRIGDGNTPEQTLDVNGSANIAGDLFVGGSATQNEIRFKGTTGDIGTSGPLTLISERVYDGTEKSELLLYKGDDGMTDYGPDRIRLKAGQILMQIAATSDPYPNGTNMLTINSSGVTVGNKLDVNGSATIAGDLYVGGSATQNEIRFKGTTDDIGTSGPLTLISERVYDGTEKSELLLYKGNDIGDSSGPDRVRIKAGEIRMQIEATTNPYSNGTDMLTINSSGITVGNKLDVNGSAIMSGTITASEFKSSNYGKQHARLSHTLPVVYNGGDCVFNNVSLNTFITGGPQVFTIITPGIYLFTLNFVPNNPGVYDGCILNLQMTNNADTAWTSNTRIIWLVGLNQSQSGSATVEITNDYRNFRLVISGTGGKTIYANELIITATRIL